MTVRECGYSFIVGTGIGGAKTQSDSGILGETDLSGLSTKFKIGLGAAPINRENTVLAFHGYFGLNTKFLLGAMVYTITEDNVCVIGYGSDSWGFGIAPGLVNIVPRFGISWLLD